jgi:hypothetical protein
VSYYTAVQLEVSDGDADRAELAERLIAAARHLINPLDLNVWRQTLMGERACWNHFAEFGTPDLKFLSAQFPRPVIDVRGWGEDFDDVWIKRYRGGRVRTSRVRRS